MLLINPVITFYTDIRCVSIHWYESLTDKNVCKVFRAAIKYSGSTANLKTHLVRRHGKNYVGDSESVDANVSNVTASTRRNTQENHMDIKDFFQPHLGEVQSNHSIYSPFYCKGLPTLHCGGEWWLLKNCIRLHHIESIAPNCSVFKMYRPWIVSRRISNHLMRERCTPLTDIHEFSLNPSKIFETCTHQQIYSQLHNVDCWQYPVYMINPSLCLPPTTREIQDLTGNNTTPARLKMRIIAD